MRRIGLLTSGGDAPGMNPCIRAVVRSALRRDVEVVGVWHGLQGLASGDFRVLTREDTVDIIGRGGTILGTKRFPEFLDPAIRQQCAAQLQRAAIEGLIICGGEGSLKAAHRLWEEHRVPVVGIPATIDNDIPGIDAAIGFDTAVNTAMEAIDKIRDTAESHGRIFFVEVMGRWSGYIALYAGIAGGAEYIALPEERTQFAELYRAIQQIGPGRRVIVVVAEGDEKGGALAFAKYFRDHYGIESRVTLLGHIQRGGSPTVQDRVLGSLLGKAAVDALLERKTDGYVGQHQGQLVFHPLTAVEKYRPIVPSVYVELAKWLV